MYKPSDQAVAIIVALLALIAAYAPAQDDTSRGAIEFVQTTAEVEK